VDPGPFNPDPKEVDKCFFINIDEIPDQATEENNFVMNIPFTWKKYQEYLKTHKQILI